MVGGLRPPPTPPPKGWGAPWIATPMGLGDSPSPPPVGWAGAWCFPLPPCGVGWGMVFPPPPPLWGVVGEILLRTLTSQLS